MFRGVFTHNFDGNMITIDKCFNFISFSDSRFFSYHLTNRPVENDKESKIFSGRLLVSNALSFKSHKMFRKYF